ncbi:MAG TPA: hypothetical protein PLL62_09025, partial [Candidatus Saccharicenans sp.]|nr:hypothetical protein [Candidatus Saccharicenans sp.]
KKINKLAPHLRAVCLCLLLADYGLEIKETMVAGGDFRGDFRWGRANNFVGPTPSYVLTC